MNETITVEQAWEVVKNDMLQKMPPEANSNILESLGLEEEKIDHKKQ